jgi:hypothetical protein
MAGRNCTHELAQALWLFQREGDARPTCRSESDDFRKLVLVLVKVTGELVACDHPQREEVDRGVLGI